MAAAVNESEWPASANAHPARARRGRSSTETARLLHISRATVHLWHRGYRAEGLVGLIDHLRSGRPTVIDPRTVEPIAKSFDMYDL